MESPKGTIRIEGLNVSYLAAGSGRPVVLVHGLGAAKSWWRHTIPHLASSLRVYALDLPGHGGTDVPAAVTDVDYGARFLLAALDALELPRTALVGHSLGGHIALAVAARAPQRVSRLVVVDSAGLGRELNWLLRAVSLPGMGELVLGFLGRRRWEVRWEYGGLFHDPSLFTPEMAADVLVNRARPGAVSILLAMLRLGVTWRGVRDSALLLDRLPLVQAPTLIVWGDQDPLFPLRHAHRARQGLRDSRLEVLSGCRHCPQLEYPERFNSIVGSFLAEGAPGLALDSRRASS